MKEVCKVFFREQRTTVTIKFKLSVKDSTVGLRLADFVDDNHSKVLHLSAWDYKCVIANVE